MSKARNLSKLLDDNGDILIENLDNVSVGFGDLTTTPTTLTGYGITDAATSAQGALADSAVQPGDNISGLTNDSGFATTTYVDTAESDAVTTANAYTDSALAGISSDAITEGNSSVEVVDTGSGYITATTDGTERMRILSNGRVGIGTTNPVRELQVGDNTGSESISIQSGSGSDGSLLFGDDQTTSAEYRGMLRYSHYSDTMRFWTSSSEQMQIDSSGNLKFNSGYGSFATAYGCRAWIQFAMDTGSIANSGGVSSITDIGTGHFRVNLSTATPDATYSVQVSDNYGQAFTETYTTSNFRVKAYNANYALRDSTLYMAAMFR